MRLKPLIYSVLLVLFAIACVAIMTTPGLKPVVISVYEPPRIHAEERVHDLGVVETDSTVSHEYLLYNLGGKHLRITGVETTCGCTVANLSRDVIPPGGFATLEVDLDTSIKLGKTRKRITVTSNDPERPALDLFLTGTVVASQKAPHGEISLKPKDPLVLFKGECATCHVMRGVGKSGKALFQADCAMCHGQNATGHGESGPSLLEGDYTDEQFVARMRQIIAEGSPRSPQMPPFSEKHGGPLTEGQIDSLITFLTFQHSQKKMGLLETEDPLDAEDEAAFREALENPH